ncbi:MFS general substrate transporter [Fistulina hepatica ATCC 64428]|nr:MFS general substrate transporter [Fistulina hepatica ATCC 64428]
MFVAVADDPDPTTQMAWPGRREESQDSEPGARATDAALHDSEQPPDAPVKPKKRLSTWNFVTLSISMAGAQIAWTVELGYGTPILLGLGLSEQLTALVWLAGPISGLVAQPVIGAISDSSTSKYRRRFWIMLSTAALVLSTLVLAYCQPLATFFVDLFRVGQGDWDNTRNHRVQSTAIGLAVTSFYILDFALNALQASLRNLLLDIAPTSQLNSGNAWHGRMTNAGNIIGYGFGFLPLAQLPILRWLGGDQFRKFCVLCIFILVATVVTTCVYHEEQAREKKAQEVLHNIYHSIVHLPRHIRRVCYVQLFAFLGWFPFLFYSTTYVGQIMAQELGREPDLDVATRKGEFAMLWYSIVAVISGIVLPHLANRDRRLLAHKADVDEDAELTRLRETVRSWRAEAARQGRPMRLPFMPFLLRNIWTGALLLFSALTFSTFFITTVTGATIFIALVGICWSVALWAPFAIIMELLKELPSAQPPTIPQPPVHTRSVSSPALHRLNQQCGERQLLLRRRSYDDMITEDAAAEPVAGGTILGIHNLAIVMPQFVIAIVSSFIFKIVDGPTEIDGDTFYGKNGVAWVLRFGGLCTLFGAMAARRVSPTVTEKAMRRRLSEMRTLRDEDLGV